MAEKGKGSLKRSDDKNWKFQIENDQKWSGWLHQQKAKRARDGNRNPRFASSSLPFPSILLQHVMC